MALSHKTRKRLSLFILVIGLPLYIDVHEDTEIYTPMSSRIAHLVLIDVLAVGVAKTRGPKLAEQLKAVKKSLTTLRYPDDH